MTPISPCGMRGNHPSLRWAFVERIRPGVARARESTRRHVHHVRKRVITAMNNCRMAVTHVPVAMFPGAENAAPTGVHLTTAAMLPRTVKPGDPHSTVVSEQVAGLSISRRKLP